MWFALLLAACTPPAERPDPADSADPPPSDDSAPPLDQDGDGHSATVDCNDLDAAIHPGAPEVCDGWDDDCDGAIDDADPDLVGASPFYADHDGDGWGGDADGSHCLRPSGDTATPGDCDDLDASTFPGAPESCDGHDESCDGRIDDACAGAPAGSLLTTDLPIAVQTPCGLNATGSDAVLADIDGDGLPDLAALTGDCPTPQLGVLRSPLAADASFAAPALHIDVPRGDVARLDGGVDVTGDGVGDWLVVAGPPEALEARLYAGPPADGATADDALATITVSPLDWGELPADVTPLLLPGDPGVLVLTGHYAPVLDEDWFYASFALPAVAGDAATAGGARIDLEGDPISRSWIEWARAGDLDGDGADDALRTFGGDTDLFLGPLDVSSGVLYPEGMIAPDATVVRVDGRGGADLDGDGLADAPLFISDEGRLARTLRKDDGTLTVDETDGIVGIPGSLPSVAFLDANGDGALDIAVGASQESTFHEANGALWVLGGPFAGARDVATAELTVRCPDADCGFGVAALAGDTNGDGLDDLVVTGGTWGLSGPFAWLVPGGGW